MIAVKRAPRVLRSMAVIVAVVAVAVAWSVGAAFAHDDVAKPVIVSSPSDPSPSIDATIRFTVAAGSSARCSLDGRSFSACSSPVTYRALGEGRHRFEVIAVRTRDKRTETSRAARVEWTIDRSAPTVRITSPAARTYGPTTWPAAVTGTAADPAGVRSVSVAIQQLATGRYWDGATFSLRSPAFLQAAGTTSWAYPLVLPADGRYTATVRAVDQPGNETPSSKRPSVTFTIDSTPPPAPTFNSKPAAETTATSATFKFSVPERNVALTCALDGSAPEPCADGNSGRGQIRYRDLTPGPHCFEVFAIDTADNRGPTAGHCWTISGGASFTITGRVAEPLYPGQGRPLELTFTNPRPAPLTVEAGSVAVSIASPSGACPAAANFRLGQSLLDPVTIPAGSTRSLSQLLPDQERWPRIDMIETNTNQDACQGLTLAFTITARARA